MAIPLARRGLLLTPHRFAADFLSVIDGKGLHAIVMTKGVVFGLFVAR